jgi:hypothetical protein
MARNLGEIRAFAQRRQRYVKRVEPKQQVGSEAAFCD